MTEMMIKTMQGRDVPGLADCFPHLGDVPFEAYYLGQLQGQCSALVALQTDADGIRNYLGYSVVRWQSGATAFWQRNIPEIVDLNVIAGARRQGIGAALLHACERAASEKAYDHIGVAIEKIQSDSAVLHLYQQCGFQSVESGLGSSSQQLYLVKVLTESK